LRTRPRPIAPADLATTSPVYLIPAAIWRTITARGTADGRVQATHGISEIDDALLGTALVVLDAAAIRAAALVAGRWAEVWMAVLTSVGRAGRLGGTAHGCIGRLEGVGNAYLVWGTWR
jgi:hypothetical protein